ncbi:MAG: PAS domain-containing protein [Alphaproteobacteria bacterium]|nr:PAS domain-containing protein [Alphaproteobacteria bacterium]
MDRLPSSNRFWPSLAALVAPSFGVLGALAYLHAIPWVSAVLAIVATIVATALLLKRHLAALARHAKRLDELAKGEPPDALARPADGGASAPIAEAVARLERALPERVQPMASEAALESIVDALPYAILQIDSDERIARANAVARALFGEGLEGKPLVAYLRDPDVLDALAEALAGAYPEAADVRLAGSVERSLRVRAVPLPRGSGSKPAALLAIADVTTVQQAERMRRDFVANVSHELRTPLATLTGFIETLQGPARDDAVARERFLSIMATQGARMTRIVTDLLSLSKIEEAEHTPPSGRIDAARVLAGTLDALSIAAKAKGTTLVPEIAADLPPVLADGDQIAQVFQNLIDNAIKYGRPGGRVRVSARVAERTPPGFVARSSRYVEVRVEDDGEGIAREHLPRLTERFYRVDAGRSREMGGTGLGLAIVKHIVNRHRGALDIESEIGRGTTFLVYLPVAETAPATA